MLILSSLFYDREPSKGDLIVTICLPYTVDYVKIFTNLISIYEIFNQEFKLPGLSVPIIAFSNFFNKSTMQSPVVYIKNLETIKYEIYIKICVSEVLKKRKSQ